MAKEGMQGLGQSIADAAAAITATMHAPSTI